MKERDISVLVKHYEDMRASGKSIYLDAEEFDYLSEYYDMMDEPTQAEEVVELGLSIHPENYQLLLRKVKLMSYRGMYREALDFLDASFTSFDLDWYLLKIESLLHLEVFDKAYALIGEAIGQEKQDKDVLFSELGFLFIELDRYDDAINYFEKSLLHNQYNEEVLTELSYAYEMNNDFSSAINVYNKILDISPYSDEVWINLGKLYSLQEEYEKAIDAFDYAYVINENNKDVLKLKAHCLSLCGRTDEAIEIFKEHLEDRPNDDSVYYSLAECYFAVEQYDDMLYYLDEYEARQGETVDVLAKKAVAYLQKEDNDKAVYFIEKGLAINPDSEDLNLVAGEYYYQTENYILAQKFFLNAYTKNKENKTLLNRLSTICIAQNDLDSAAKFLTELVEDDDERDVESLIQLALIYFEIEDKEKFNQLLEKFTDDELRALLSMFFSEEHLDMDSMSRSALIGRLNDAKECRQLYKNIKY